MDYHDYARLSRKALFALLEQERQEWLAAGMGEADIFRVHFGDSGKGGDYAVWLAERKHVRPDHKYAPGEPISLDALPYEGERLAGRGGGIAVAEVLADLGRALRSLTALQRRYFVLTRLKGYSCSEIARLDGKQRSTVHRLAASAAKKIRNIF